MQREEERRKDVLLISKLLRQLISTLHISTVCRIHIHSFFFFSYLLLVRRTRDGSVPPAAVHSEVLNGTVN